MSYGLKIYITGQPGYYYYEVGTKDQAMTHFGAITNTGYRRINDRGQLVWYSPSQIGSISITGDGLETQYPDEFRRT